jgi:hypothetical protein
VRRARVFPQRFRADWLKLAKRWFYVMSPKQETFQS